MDIEQTNRNHSKYIRQKDEKPVETVNYEKQGCKGGQEQSSRKRRKKLKLKEFLYHTSSFEFASLPCKTEGNAAGWRFESGC